MKKLRCLRSMGRFLAAVLVCVLSACAAPPQDQAATAGGTAGSMSLGSLALLPLPGSAGSDAVEDTAYTNATYGFSFDPSFCEDLVLVDEARDAAVFQSEAWGMTAYIQGAENTEDYDAQSLTDAILMQASVPDGDPVVGDGYCVVQQMERDFETREERVVTYVFFVGSGNYQGIVCEFDPEIYASLTQEQGSALVAAFLPGDLTAVHEDLREPDTAQ